SQRLPPIIDRRPGTDLPPQPPAISNDLGYRRWHLSFETYPIVSYVQAPGFTGVRTAPSWSTLGIGTRADYLVNRNVSATLDLTSSFIGGPVMVNTAELGTRLHPEWAEHKLYPYLDLRVGYDVPKLVVGATYAHCHRDRLVAPPSGRQRTADRSTATAAGAPRATSAPANADREGPRLSKDASVHRELSDGQLLPRAGLREQ